MDDLHQRIDALAAVRGEDRSQVIKRFGEAALRKAPISYSKHIPALRDMRFAACGIDGDLAFVRTTDGLTLYSFPSQRNHRTQFRFVADLMPSNLSEETFLSALDATHRYLSDFAWPPADLLPPKGGTVVELGAYLGHKTLRFAETVGHEGKVLAVEMMTDNATVLRKNASANGYGDVIDVMEIGVWKEPDTIAVRSKGRQRNSLIDLEKLDQTEITVPVDSIDAILDRWNQPKIDFLYMSINGVEAEALNALDRWLDRIKVLFVIAPYKDQNGRPSADTCREILAAKGRSFADVGNKNRVAAI